MTEPFIYNKGEQEREGAHQRASRLSPPTAD